MAKPLYPEIMKSIIARESQPSPLKRFLVPPRFPSIQGKKADVVFYDDIFPPKSKFAPVVPYHMYQQFLINGYVPDSVLLLAHDVVAHPNEYNELFKEPSWDSTTIFMDNSLVELKAAVDIEMVASAVETIDRPQVVVICPDVMAEAEASAKLTLDAWPEWSWRFRNYETLVVLQGSKMNEFLGCAEYLEPLDPDWVSIPRVTEGLFGYHRRELIPYIKAIFPDSKMHLLGFSDFIWEDLRAAASPHVSSIDSAVPFRMASKRIFSEVVRERGDWWKTGSFVPEDLDRIAIIDSYISRLL